MTMNIFNHAPRWHAHQTADQPRRATTATLPGPLTANTFCGPGARYGFKDEAPLYDNSFQPFAQIFIMRADGSDHNTRSTYSRWEDSMPGDRAASGVEKAQTTQLD